MNPLIQKWTTIIYFSWKLDSGQHCYTFRNSYQFSPIFSLLWGVIKKSSAQFCQIDLFHGRILTFFTFLTLAEINYLKITIICQAKSEKQSNHFYFFSIELLAGRLWENLFEIFCINKFRILSKKALKEKFFKNE